MAVFFSDLDGSLLDHDTYSWEAAEEGLRRAVDEGHAVVIVSSKTRAEVEPLHRDMGLGAFPFVIENGGAICFPDGRFVELGARIEDLVKALERAATEAGARVRGFSRMTAEEIAERTGLALGVARLAREREFDEPFVVEAGDAGALQQAILRNGYQHTEGGRFHHILKGSDKAKAVGILMDGEFAGWPSVGLGDGLNDAGFLALCDSAWLIPSKHTEVLKKKLPLARLTSLRGPAGWNEAVLAELGRSVRLL